MGVKDGIEHIDTNILIRLITRDEPELVARAEKLIAKKDKLYIFEDAAMMEVVFVITGDQYRYSRAQAAESIKTMMRIDNICFNKGVIEDALDLYVAHPKLSFVDCYLWVIAAISQELPLWTLDRKLANQCPVAKAL